MPCPFTVIFDIDETLVYYISNRLKPASWDTLPASEQAKYKVVDAGSGIFLVRPHLNDLLDFLQASGCKVGLWTWSDKGYAMGMRSSILSGRDIKFVLHDDHAEASSEKHGNSKDLNFLWYGEAEKECLAECNTIIIDDLPGNAANSSNIRNSITIEPFAPFGEVKNRSDPYKDCSGDTVLLECIEIIKRILPQAAKCYEVDEKRWTNVFSKENIAAAGLEDKVKNIKMKNGKVVRGIGAGNSHFFIRGGNRKTFKRSSRALLGRSQGTRRRSSTTAGRGRRRYTSWK
jgi:hypothetical protein